MTAGLGTVYTPEAWAGWLLDQGGAARRWLDGASVMDPSCGEGAFLLALVEQGRKLLGLTPGQVDQLPLERLYGADVDAEGLRRFHNLFQQRYGSSFPEANLRNRDILLDGWDLRADILAGNPPWVSYTVLPREYQQRLRPLFVQYGLTGDGRNLLLGSSRVDLSALVTAKTVADNLNPGGEALFFLPLSLFLSGGAHGAFRRCEAAGMVYAPRRIYDLAGAAVFPGVETRYGAVLFQRDQRPAYPLEYWIYQGEGKPWLVRQARPYRNPGDPLAVAGEEVSAPFQISLSRQNRPRQGVNTCGRNGLLIFRPRPDNLWQPGDASLPPASLPDRFLFPLADRRLFQPSEGNAKEPDGREETVPQRYILLLHHRDTGKPLAWEELEDRGVEEYLRRHQESLASRRGTLIRGLIRRGFWWACLGVGPYSFAPFKVMWQALGTGRFLAAVVSEYQGRPWQGNQAMHGFIPAWEREEAERIAGEMNSGGVQNYLEQFRMAGTKSWAQVGRILPLLHFRA